MIDTKKFRQSFWITMTSKFWILSSINKKIIVRILSFRTLYYNMIKTILFFIMNRNRSLCLQRLMHWHFWISTTIRWRIKIYSLNYATIFFSCFSNSWFRRSFTSFCRANSSCCCFLRFALMSKMIKERFWFWICSNFFLFRNDHFSFMKKRFWFDEFCDNEFENFANRLRFFCEVQSHFDSTCQIDFLSFFYSYFTIRNLRDVLAIFACVASFVLVDDVKIAIARAMFFRARVAYDSSFAVFIDMIVFLTVKALS